MIQQQGAGQAIVGLTDGAVPFWVGAGAITLFMIVYVAVSGMRGVAWTDTLQGTGDAWAHLGRRRVVLSAVGGLSSATASMGEANPEFLALGGGLYSPQYVISTAVSIAFGVTMFPQINQRFFVARSEKVLKRTLALWPVLVVLLFVPAFMLGAWAAGLGVTVPENGKRHSGHPERVHRRLVHGGRHRRGDGGDDVLQRLDAPVGGLVPDARHLPAADWRECDW